MPFANVTEILRNLGGQVWVIDLTPEDAATVETLAKKIQMIYDHAVQKQKLKSS